MYCTNCGERITSKMLFCPRCGRKHNKNYKKTICVVTIMLMVMATIIIFMLFKRKSVENAQSSAKNSMAQTNETSMYVENITQVENEADMLVTEEFVTIINESELTLEQRIESIFIDGVVEGDKLDAIMMDYEQNSDLYILLSNKFMDFDKIDLAKEILLYGFEKTEDRVLMDAYLELAVDTLAEEYGLVYDILYNLVEIYAEETDNTSKLEIAKKIYFYIQLANENKHR